MGDVGERSFGDAAAAACGEVDTSLLVSDVLSLAPDQVLLFPLFECFELVTSGAVDARARGALTSIVLAGART